MSLHVDSSLMHGHIRAIDQVKFACLCQNSQNRTQALAQQVKQEMLSAINNVGKLFPLGWKQNKNRAPSKRALTKDGKNKVSAALPGENNGVCLRTSTLQLQQQGCFIKKKQSWVRRCASSVNSCPQEMVNTALPVEGPMKDYTIKEFLGMGAYGKVFSAQHSTSGEVVAVKEVDDCQAGMAEAGIMAMLRDCPSAVHLKDAGAADSREVRFFIVMDLCEGGDLGSFVEVNTCDTGLMDGRFGGIMTSRAVVICFVSAGKRCPDVCADSPRGEGGLAGHQDLPGMQDPPRGHKTV